MAATEATRPSLTSSQVAPEPYVLAGGTTLLNAEAAAIWEQALAKASAYLAELLTRADRDTLLNEVFGRAGTEATVFETNKQALLEAIGTTGLRIAIDLRNNTEMEGAIGAYAQVGPNGNEIIYINADWIIAGNLSLEQLTAVVLEEYGHALDVRLNPGLESPGDEGELFASLITNAGLNADQFAAINTQNDWGTVQVDGQTMAVEKAVANNGVTSPTLGTNYNNAQTISPTTAAAISVRVNVNNTNNNGADILIAAYQGTALIGWSVYDRATNLDGNTNSDVTSQAGPVTLTFNLAQFNTSLTAGNSTTGLVIKAWQGTFNGSSATNVTTATASGTGTSVAFTPNTLIYSTNTTVSGSLTAGSDSRGWAVNASDLTPPTVTITDSDANTVNIADGTVTFTFTFTGAVTGFDTSKVTVGNGTKGTFSGSGTTYSLVVTPTASSSGNITVDVITTGVTDAAGNQATVPAQYTQAFDTAAPTLAITTPISTDGFVNNTEDESSLIISGTSSGADGRTVTVAVGSITAKTATIAAGGAWSISLTSAEVKTLTQGTVNITANVSDMAGNPATPASASFVYDITAPNAPAITSVTDDVSPLTGTVASGGSTNDTVLVLAGTAEASSTITIYDGSTSLGTTSSDGSGAWSFTTATLNNGTIYTFNATATDAAGNVSSASANYTVTVDTAASNAPSITSVSDDVAPITGTIASGGSTNDTVLVLAGSAEANSTVTVYNGGTSLGTTSANGSGAWSFTTATLSNGSTYSFNATATDAAGNVSAASANYIVTVDTAAPTLLSSTPADGATDAGVSNNLVLNFSETIAAGSGLISLYRADGSLVESFDAATGVGSAGGSLIFSGSAVTIKPFADLVRGSGYYLQVAATAIRDSAGNLYAGISDATTLNFTTAAVTLSVGSITVSESSLYAVVAVGLDAAISDNLSFTPTLLSGTASIGSDAGSTLQVFNGTSWVSAAAGVSLAAGSTSLLLRVAINNDTTLEGLETFQISTGAITGAAAALTNASGASGTVTIADDGSSAQIFDQDTNSPAPLLRSTDNDTPSIAVSSVIVSEASPYAVLELSLTNPSNFAVSFTPTLQSGSASIGVDTGSSLEVFNGSTWQAAGQLSLAAGVTSRLVRVAIANDSAYENSETFTISTGAISGPIANPAGASGTVTIRDNGSSNNTFLADNTSAIPTAGSADNDTPVLPALSAAVLSNGNETGPLATSFRISRTGDTSSALVATYRFAGSAIAGSDYTNPAGFDASTGLGSVTIAAGQSSVDLNVASLDDSAVDGNRSLSLLLQSSLDYSLAAATATATILDNDVAPPLTPTFAISSASVVETDLSSNPLVNLIVSLSGPAATSVSVRVRTLAALSGSSATGTTASGGGDYVAISDQLLTFLPGSTSQLLPIQLLGDNTIETTESFRIELFDASGANLPAAAATIEIVDNDTGKSLTINNSAATTSQTFSGGQYADILIGGSAADTINGDPAGLIGGGDAITGNGGADILTGGPGADRFRYLSFSDSTLSSTDRIRDLTLTGTDQDRIALAALPAALWNTGAITPTSPTLASAVAAAFADKDRLTAGNQALAAGEAVLFAYDSTPGNALTRQWFVAVNDSTAAFSSSSDLLINVTGLKSSFASGSLTPGLLFATL